MNRRSKSAGKGLIHYARFDIVAIVLALLIVGWTENPASAADPIAPPAQTTNPPRRFNTIAHQMLDLEREVTTVSDKKYKLLDDILQDAKAKIAFDPSVTDPAARRKQMLAGLAQIARLLENYHVIYPPGEWIDTLGQGLMPQPSPDDPKQIVYYMDCDIRCFVYMAIGEAVGFDLKLVEAPQHNFVRYHLGEKEYIDWETTTAKESNDDHYRGPKVTPWAEKERSFLASMTQKEVIGYFYTCRGLECEHLKPANYKQAASDYRKSISMYPQSALPRNNLAWLYVAIPDLWKGDKTDAVQLALRACSIVPKDAEYIDTLATAYAEGGDFDVAIAFELEAIRFFKPTDPAHANDKEEFEKRLAGFREHKTYLQQKAAEK